MNILVFGATSTISIEIQKIWASQGHKLTLIGRQQDTLKDVASDLSVRGANYVSTIAKDLSDISHADGFISDLWNLHGPFDLVFMAHGVLGDQKQCEKSAAETLSLININFGSHIAFLTAIANKMEQLKSGTIAVITSVAGDRVKQSNYIYGTAKAAKIAFLSGLRNRLAPSNVAVVDLRLGFTDTKMTASFKKGLLWAQPTAVARSMDKAIRKKKDIKYIPGFWFIIMGIIKSIPESIFKKLKL